MVLERCDGARLREVRRSIGLMPDHPYDARCGQSDVNRPAYVFGAFCRFTYDRLETTVDHGLRFFPPRHRAERLALRAGEGFKQLSFKWAVVKYARILSTE